MKKQHRSGWEALDGCWAALMADCSALQLLWILDRPLTFVTWMPSRSFTATAALPPWDLTFGPGR